MISSAHNCLVSSENYVEETGLVVCIEKLFRKAFEVKTLQPRSTRQMKNGFEVGTLKDFKGTEELIVNVI